MKKERLKVRGNRWCKVEIILENGRLSICGEEGRVIRRATAKREALDYWRSFFEDQPEEIMGINKRFHKRFTSATGAARFVLEMDGDLHGMDVSGPEDGATVRVVESCGQITDVIADYFPEVAPLLKYHLNDMRAECEHQEARGETWKTHPSAVCPECGYSLGSKWLRRELPAEVVAAVEAL